MFRRVNFIFTVVMAGLFLSTPLSAHHGTGINYDSSIKFTLPAVVTKFRYAQPHLQIFLDMPDIHAEVAEGEEPPIVNWACEYVPNIPFLIREGYSRRMMQAALPKGAEITVVMTPARSGKAVCLVHKMVGSDGEVIGPDLEAMVMQGSRK